MITILFICALIPTTGEPQLDVISGNTARFDAGIYLAENIGPIHTISFQGITPLPVGVLPSIVAEPGFILSSEIFLPTPLPPAAYTYTVTIVGLTTIGTPMFRLFGVTGPAPFPVVIIDAPNVHIWEWNQIKRGDANSDGTTNIADAIFLLLGGISNCEDSSDMNDDGRIDIADPIGILNILFNPGPGAPLCELDSTLDFLDCEIATCP